MNVTPIRKPVRKELTHVVNYHVHACDRDAVCAAWNSAQREYLVNAPDVSVRVLEAGPGSTFGQRMTLIVRASLMDAENVSGEIVREFARQFDLAANRAFSYLESLELMSDIESGFSSLNSASRSTPRTESRLSRHKTGYVEQAHVSA